MREIINNWGVWKFFPRMLFSFSGFLVFLLLLLVFYIRLHNLSVPIPDLVAYEPNVIYSLQNYISGEGLYNNPELPHYAITQYTPIYYNVCYWMSFVFGTDVNVPLDVFFLSRTVSLIFNFLTGLLIYLFLFRCVGVSRFLSFVGFSLVFVYIEPHAYSRPDSVYNFMFLISVCVFYVMIKSQHSKRYLVLSSFLVIATIFAKQTGLILILINILYFLFARRYLLLAMQVFFYCLFFILFLFIFVDNIELFINNVVNGVNNGLDFKGFYPNLIQPSIEKFNVLLVIGLIVSLYWLRGSLQMFYLSLVAILSFGWALGTGLKWGSTPSYFSDFINVVVILSIAFYSQVETERVKIPFVIVVLFLMFSRTINTVWEKNYVYDYTEYYKSEKVAMYMNKEVRLGDNDLVFCDKHNWMDNFLYKNIIFPHKEVATTCYLSQAFNYNQANEIISKGKVKYVISKGGALAKFLFFDFKNYKLLKKIEDYNIYVRY